MNTILNRIASIILGATLGIAMSAPALADSVITPPSVPPGSLGSSYNYDALKGRVISCSGSVSYPNGCDGGVQASGSAAVDGWGNAYVYAGSSGWVRGESVVFNSNGCGDVSKQVNATVTPIGLTVTAKHDRGAVTNCYAAWSW